MFCDETKITLKAGRGGDGWISFFKTRTISKGGPDGGNGGKGGDIMLKANENLNSLIALHTHKKFKAEPGKAGFKSDMAGRGGEDLVLEVPMGTKVFQDGKLIVDLKEHNNLAILAVGGRGGYGNAHFTSSVRQAPKFAELGEPGEEKEISLELSLVADAGIIGLPSAGKSTLISVVSSARPKIGAFPFTTLVPNLAVAQVDNQNSLVLCDVPGLIEGAHKGKGLGHQFLRHISRNRVLVHLVSAESENLLKDAEIIEKELEKFSSELAKTPAILVVSKIDLVPKERLEEIKKELKGREFLMISSATHQGTKELLAKVFKMVQKEKGKRREVELKAERIILRPHLEGKISKRFETERINGKSFRVRGPRIEQIAIMTDYANFEALMRLRDVMRKMGIEKELMKIGAIRGDKIFFGDTERGLELKPKLLK